MTVALDDIVRATVRFALPAASAIENVWHFVIGGTGTATDLDVATAVETFLSYVYETLDILMDDETTLVDVVINTLLFVVDHWETGVYVNTLDEIGAFTPASGGDPMPPGVTAMQRYLSQFPRHEGRKYYAPFTESTNADSLITSSLTDLLSLVAIDILLYEADIPNSNLTLALVNLTPDAELYTIPDHAIHGNRWAYQRRRKLYVGL